MKTIGLFGGTSWESRQVYYRIESPVASPYFKALSD